MRAAWSRYSCGDGGLLIREEESTPTYRWVVIGSLTASVGTTLTILFTLGLLLPDMSKDLGLSPSQQGWLASSVVFGNLLFAIPTNLWLSRYRPWRVASLAFLLVGLFTLLQGWSPLLAVLIIGRIGTGLSFMASQAPRALLIQQWTPRRKLAMTNGIVFGAIDLIMGGAFFLIPILMGWVDGWRNTLYVLAGISLFLAAFWMIAGRERITPGYQERMLSQEQTPLMTILRYPQLWFMGLAMIGAMVGQTAFQTFWPTLAQDELGLSAVVAGSALGLVSIVAAPIDMMVNIVPSLVRRQPLVLAVCGIINTFTMLGLLYADSTPLVLLLSVVKGFSFSFFPVLMVMVYQLPGIKPREVALGIAVMQTCIWIGAGIGPLVVGFLEEATGDLRFALLVT
ncbi:MAG: CynX/NimT family MFS transporter, partial [Dehalococcoidia bacterium]